MLGKIVKFKPLLPAPLTCTTTFPVVAPEGTVTAMLVAVQLEALAVVPLNVTVLLPWVDPKLVPVIVTDAPTVPDVCERFVMLGEIVKLTPLLSTPLAWTTTLPV